MKCILQGTRWQVFCSVFLSVIFVFAIVSTSFAQSSQQKPGPPPSGPLDTINAQRGSRGSPSDDGSPLTTFEEEMRAKRAIKLAEKEHQENVDRAREISQLAHDLQAHLKNKSTAGRDDLKKIERLEKLTKKILGEAGGEDGGDTTLDKQPTDAASALTQITEVAESLSKDVQNTPRQVVSASVISTANVLLELIKVFRSFGR